MGGVKGPEGAAHCGCLHFAQVVTGPEVLQTGLHRLTPASGPGTPGADSLLCFCLPDQRAEQTVHDAS